MFKNVAAALILFLASFCSAFAQGGTVPTLGRNNTWTGSNLFQGGVSIPALRQCTSPQVMAGFSASFQPLCVSVTGTNGVSSIQGLTNAVGIVDPNGKLQVGTIGQSITISCPNCLTSAVTSLAVGANAASGALNLAGDANVTVALTGQTFQFHCPGCGTGGGGTPGGAPGALQFNSAGAFGGVVVTGMVKSSSAGPTAAIADTDFALPFTLSCSNGITCPKTGENYAFSYTGAAGSGNVGSGLIGQMSGYSANGTTVAPAPNVYFVNGAWSLGQLTGFFSRFSGATVTSWAIASNVVTMQAANAYNTGDVVDLLGFVNGTFFNNQSVTVLSSGLSNSQFQFSFTHVNASTTADSGVASINIPLQTATVQGVAILPPGMKDRPSTAFVNGASVFPAAQVLDWRKGYGLQQASAYGVKCDMRQLFVTLTQGSANVFVGSAFSDATEPVGMTFAVGTQPTFGHGGTQADWEPTVISYADQQNLTLSSVAPFNYTGNILIGTNNQAALQRAFNDTGNGIVPIWLPQCQMLTNTVRWNGASIIGNQMYFTGLNGFPGKDVLQQQTSLPITSWAINSTAGTTTFTIPSYAAHHLLATTMYPAGSQVKGDSVVLNGFPTATFFNNQTVTIYDHPSPTTFVVQSAFGQSTTSGTDDGHADPTTNVNANGIRVENLSVKVNQSIDGSFAWTHYDGNNSSLSTVQPPYYRPGQSFNQAMNNPNAPGWGQGQTNGVAAITQNTGVICVSSVTGARQPTVGQVIVFPYQGSGSKSFSVVSTAGSCSTGSTPFTLGSYKGGASTFPNTSAFTSTQAEWWSYNVPQSLAASIPPTITYPYNLYLNLPFPPVPGFESNVSSHGHIVINGDEFDYMGELFGGTASSSWSISSVANASGGSTTYTGTFSSLGFSCTGSPVLFITGFSNPVNNGAFTCTSNTSTTFTVNNTLGVAQTQAATVQYPAPTITLRKGPTTINSGAGDVAGSVVFPLNPCEAMYDNPWPVIPTLNSGQATPVNATYYAGICGGEAAISLPMLDGLSTTFNGSGFSLGYFNNVYFPSLLRNGLGNANSNASIAIYEAGNYTGYGDTFDAIRVDGNWAGLMQGAASVNQHGVKSIGPTSTGQSWKDCTFRSGYGFSIVNMQQSNMDRCDTYATETSPYDGTVVGNTTGMFIGYTVSEQDGSGVTSVGQFTVKDYNQEPEAGNAFEIPPSLVSDGTQITWIGNIFEGGYNIFGGSYQNIQGTQMSVPVFNYGNGNYFSHLNNLNTSVYDSNVYNGTSQFYNWGQNSTCQATTGGSIGPLRTCGVGFVQDYNGHDAWASMMGNGLHPTENILGGMITPQEFSNSGLPTVFDPTELWWGQHAECTLVLSGECVMANFDGFAGAIYIGPHQRITDAPMVLKGNVKLKNTGSTTFRVFITAQPSSPGCVPNFSLASQTVSVTSTGWTPFAMPVDFTGTAGCTITIQLDSILAANTVELGYFNFVPFASQLFIPIGTPTSGAACPVAGEFKIDATHLWICAANAFGAGTWKSSPVT